VAEAVGLEYLLFAEVPLGFVAQETPSYNSVWMPRRGYYRIPTKSPANRVDGPLAEAVQAKYAEGWPKARIAREFRLNRRTVMRICAVADNLSNPQEASNPIQTTVLIKCVGCGITIPNSILTAHWPYCPAVLSGRVSLEECPTKSRSGL
jgi:hypothetical protein